MFEAVFGDLFGVAGDCSRVLMIFDMEASKVSIWPARTTATSQSESR